MTHLQHSDKLYTPMHDPESFVLVNLSVALGKTLVSAEVLLCVSQGFAVLTERHLKGTYHAI